MSLLDRADAAMAATRHLDAEIARLRAENERMRVELEELARQLRDLSGIAARAALARAQEGP